jgi:hypothetical protein
MTWGVADEVTARFTAAGVPKDNIAFARDIFTFNYPGPPSRFVGEFRSKGDQLPTISPPLGCSTCPVM